MNATEQAFEAEQEALRYEGLQRSYMNRELSGPTPPATLLAGLGIVGTFAMVIVAMIVTIGIM